MSAYSFRPVAPADLPLLHEWRARPHWVQWWGPAEEGRGFFEEAMADPHTAAWMVELDGRPFAYAQDYDPHAFPGHPFAHLPVGARGIDQSIGDLDLIGRGHGSAFVRAHCDRLFAAGAPAIGTDPHPDNARAIRAYERAGFTIPAGPVDTPWGRAVLMERWRSSPRPLLLSRSLKHRTRAVENGRPERRHNDSPMPRSVERRSAVSAIMDQIAGVRSAACRTTPCDDGERL